MGQLWANQIAEYRFELCCIPFFAYDLALGDIVETDEEYQIKQVSEPSGRFTFRVWFGASAYPQSLVTKELSERGALIERSSAKLIAVDAADMPVAQRVADLLHAQRHRRRQTYEAGKCEAREM